MKYLLFQFVFFFLFVGSALAEPVLIDSVQFETITLISDTLLELKNIFSIVYYSLLLLFGAFLFQQFSRGIK